MISLKNINFLKKKSPKKFYLYLAVICNPAQLQDENTKVKFMLEIIEQVHVGAKTTW